MQTIETDLHTGTQPDPKPKKSRIRGVQRLPGKKAISLENHTLDDTDILADDYVHHAFCPTCGRANPVNHSPEWLLNRFTGLIGRILSILIEARRTHRHVSLRTLQIEAYANHIGKPPTQAAGNIRICLAKNRPRLWEFGWDIVGPQITGLGFQLVALVEPS